jgi:alanyl-tRNA synthetase
MMTQRLFHEDPHLRNFTATVLERSEDGLRVILDRTAFYATSGGQPHDVGRLIPRHEGEKGPEPGGAGGEGADDGGVGVVDVVEEGSGAPDGGGEGDPPGERETRIVHHLTSPFPGGAGDVVEGWVDGARRDDFTRQHTGQHLLSALFADHCGLKTVAVHFGVEHCTLDLDAPTVPPEVLEAVQEQANRLVGENRRVVVTLEDPLDAARRGLRKPTGRNGRIRVVSVQGVDRSACGGTHVEGTAGIGPILLGGTERVRRETRVTFLCGDRVLRRARQDREILEGAARLLGASPDRVPALVEGLRARVKEAESWARRLEGEVATLRAGSLREATPPDADGIRRIVGPPWVLADMQEGAPPTMETLQALGQALSIHPDTLLVGVTLDPPGVLLAAGAATGIHAGDALRGVLAPVGGRGGGSPTVARGVVPGREALEGVVARLRALGPTPGPPVAP